MKSVMLAALTLLVVGCNRPKEEYSTNKHQADMLAMFNTHMTSIQAEGDKVKLVSDGKIGLPSGGTDPNGVIMMGKGDRIITAPDHHTASIFEFSELKENSAVFKYDHKFDHRSFGQDKMTMDRGEFEVSFKQ